MDDFVLNVRQIAQYPLAPSVGPADVALIQQTGIGGPYVSMLATSVVATALENAGVSLHIAPGSGIAWNGCQLTSDGITINVPSLHSAGDIFVAGNALATQINVDQLFDSILENSVFTVNGRKGNVVLQESDILQAGAAPIINAHFGGFNTSPTPWDFRASSDQIATTAFVQLVISQALCGGSLVTSFNGRGGAITLTTADVNAAYFTSDGSFAQVPTAPMFDASTRIASTMFVDNGIEDLRAWTTQQINNAIGMGPGGPFAPLNSPSFTGTPTAPTPVAGDSSGNLATTAFVHAAVVAATTGVASFNTRTGAVVLSAADVTGVGGAMLASPSFSGVPLAPTATAGTNSAQLATCAFVQNQLAAGNVSAFNTRTGAVTLLLADVTGAGGAPVASPALTGTPTAPTAATATSTTQLATTAFVHAAITAVGAGVASFNTRTGAVSFLAADLSAVGGAMLNSPSFTGVPLAPTAAPGANTTQIATTAFVANAIGTGAGVTSFNTRTGAVTLALGDVTAVGGAALASPNFSGIPTAPTAAPGTNTAQLATTAFVAAAIGGGTVVTAFNTRSGAVTLNTADITGAGGAPAASPVFTGTPVAPTVAQTDNSTTLATTAYVRAAVAAGSGVSTFNGRNGAVTFLAADLSAVGGAMLAGPAFTGVPTAPTPVVGTNTTQIATCAYVISEMATLGGVSSFNTRAGAVTLSTADVVGVSGALLTVAAAAPTGAPATANSALWWDSVGGSLYLNYNDGSSTQWVNTNGAVAAVLAPTRTVLLSGSGTYTTPGGCTWLQVEMVGGGGGGASNGGGGTGGNTAFGASLTANGGTGTSAPTGVGGTATGGDINIAGEDGGPPAAGYTAATVSSGGYGGGSAFFGGRGGGVFGGAGLAAKPNSGGGGAGGGSQASVAAAPGGGGGGSLRKLIAAPAATYAYAVGAGGAGGATGANIFPGGNGAAGIIIVTEHYGS